MSTFTPTYGWIDPSDIGRLSSPCPDCSEAIGPLNRATRAHYEAEVTLVAAREAFGKAMQAPASGEHREREAADELARWLA